MPKNVIVPFTRNTQYLQLTTTATTTPPSVQSMYVQIAYIIINTYQLFPSTQHSTFESKHIMPMNQIDVGKLICDVFSSLLYRYSVLIQLVVVT